MIRICVSGGFSERTVGLSFCGSNTEARNSVDGDKRTVHGKFSISSEISTADCLMFTCLGLNRRLSTSLDYAHCVPVQ